MDLGHDRMTIFSEIDLPVSQLKLIKRSVFHFISVVESNLRTNIPNWIKEHDVELRGILDPSLKLLSQVLDKIQYNIDYDVANRVNEWLVTNIITEEDYPEITEWDVLYNKVHSFILVDCELKAEGTTEHCYYPYIRPFTHSPTDIASSILHRCLEKEYLDSFDLDYFLTGLRKEDLQNVQ